jgi:hypothetical protein
MNVRIVAYRPPDSTTTNDTAYELDLQEAPNISLNFQFSDIKEPETRKGSYSQTFKLPFTENNNNFFENWYNVNLETLVFSTTKKFNVVVFVGATPQFEGVLKLQAVYTKAKQYEIVIMANTADLFAEIGDKKIVDAIGSELNHVYSYDNIKLSWEGASSSFLNTSSVSLRDADAGVQKVMYPITVSEVNKFYFGGMTAQGTGIHLNMNQATFTALDSDTEAADKMTSITQLKPAVQLKAILKLIIANAGFSYTSSFIDGSYFGKIFMTTCNALDSVVPPILNLLNFPGGLLNAESDGFGTFTGFNGATIISANEWVDAVDFSDSNDNQGALLADGQTFQIVSPVQNAFTLQIFSMTSTRATTPASARARMIPVIGGVPQYESDGILESEDVNLSWSTGVTQNTLNSPYFAFSTPTPIVGAQYRIQVCVTEDVIADSSVTGTFQFTGGSGNTTKVDAQWFDYSQNPLGNTIDIAACIDSNITQKEFLKDILERFNMVIIADPSDPTKLLIEPYTDYLADGSIKNWTEKLDVSKEIVVKDTSSLQKKIINLSDLEDVDLLNKLTAEFNPSDNVYGKYYQTNTSNEFATGELKNNSIFSPYRIEDVYRDSSGELNPLGPGNLSVHYVFSTENTPDGVVDVLKNTKPKIFYYRGDPTPIQTYASADTVSIFMHSINYGTIPATRTAFEFTEYPVCSVWDVDTGASSYTYTLTSGNKSLFWGFAPPDNPDNQIFNFNGDNVNSTWEKNTLYGLYWASYLNATYSSEARLMECYLNLNEVDIYNFKFNDEIFIKDTYWRILNINNYQVADSVSTKVVLLKSIDTLGTIGSMPVNLGAEAMFMPPEVGKNNLFLNNWYTWCPKDRPTCTPPVSAAPYTGIFADPASCENLPNAEIDKTLDYDSIYSSYSALDGLVACVQVQGNKSDPASLPILKRINSALSILSRPAIKSYFKAKLNKNFVRGSANTKFSKLMIPQTKDDLGIKYVSKFTNMPQVSGESHKLIMLATTTNIQTVASYIQGDNKKLSIPIPDTSNMMIQVNGMTTIVSSTNATYGVGVTEQFVYYTAFRNINNTVTQIGTALGKRQITQVEGGSANSFLEITSADDTETGGKKLVINAKSTEDNTIKVFTLDVNITLQRIHSLNFDTNWALYQNGNRIQFQNNDFLIWN